MRLAYAISLAALAVGCGDNSLMTNQDMAKGGGDSAVPKDMAVGNNDMAVSGDMTSAGDMAREIPDSDGVSCGMGQACMNGQQCCVVIMGMMATPMCMDSCPDGSLDVMCDGPEDCSGNPCCASVNLLQMSVNSIMCTQAQTDCNPNIFGGMTRLCHVNPDCTDGAPNTQDPTCCTIMQNGNATHICANDTLAQMSGGLLTCP